MNLVTDGLYVLGVNALFYGGRGGVEGSTELTTPLGDITVVRSLAFNTICSLMVPWTGEEIIWSAGQGCSSSSFCNIRRIRSVSAIRF